MFTGIIEDIGTVQSIKQKKETIQLNITANKIDLQASQVGASIAVNGVCLTITAKKASSFTADVMPETFRITNLAKLKKDDAVNLERAIPIDGRFNGHFVLGHVDQTTNILRRYQDQTALIMVFKMPFKLQKQIVTKGSIAIDGISLTIIHADKREFKVGLIPHSQQEATLADKRIGNVVNLETDVLAKYIEKQMQISKF
ncbi:ribB protein [Liquorilactobacillus aquaticus DSM 21051]|uniref:Riboflavin synthase n=1 Tax=Liquorilactobacillus aquaticus DSM 21051 TaxID=1423725 RepID=A0A0R2CXS7_9LACO|nr:riboflavin synthase [Liquorilactobacillus aquaticus]KRM96082.1 ribB protein [Liquorilactobacillus aquaticus DSM 21051]